MPDPQAGDSTGGPTCQASSRILPLPRTIRPPSTGSPTRTNAKKPATARTSTQLNSNSLATCGLVSVDGAESPKPAPLATSGYVARGSPVMVIAWPGPRPTILLEPSGSV